MQAVESGGSSSCFPSCDGGGGIPGKSTHVSSLETRVGTGIELTVAMQAESEMDDLRSVEGMSRRRDSAST